jgi:cytochrome c
MPAYDSLSNVELAEILSFVRGNSARKFSPSNVQCVMAPMAAGFVKANMVMGHGQKFPLGQGNLSDQDAVDVAEYFTHMPRPDFPEKIHDWPKGGKPKDARY